MVAPYSVISALCTLALAFGLANAKASCRAPGSSVPGKWTTQLGGPMPYALGEIASAAITIQGVPHLLVVGEASATTPCVTGTTFLLNLDTNTWYTGAPRPYPCHHHAVEVINNKVYLIGGVGIQSCAQAVRIYDPDTNTWTATTNHPIAGGQGSAASAQFGTDILVCGGISKFASGTADGTISNCFVFDTLKGKWRNDNIPDMPVGVNHAAAATAQGKLWVMGGRGGKNIPSIGYDYVQVYDPSNNQWTTSINNNDTYAPLPAGRGGMGKAAVINDDWLVVMGGESPAPADPTIGLTSAGTYSRVDIYSISCNAWYQGPDMPLPRHGIFPTIMPDDNTAMYVYGGGVKAANSQSAARTILNMSYP